MPQKIAVLVLFLAGLSLAQAVTYTQVTDTINDPNGSPSNGLLMVTPNGFPGGTVMPFNVRVSNGHLSTLIVASTPYTGAYYSVSYTNTGATYSFAENWSVPAQTFPVNRAQIRTTAFGVTTTTTANNAAVAFSAGSQTVTLSATVTSTSSVNTGTVLFTLQTAGGSTVGTPVTSSTVSSGAASVTYTIPAGQAPASYTIQALYSGAGSLSASSDNTHTLTITGGGGGSGTVTSVTATPPLTGGTITASGSIGCTTATDSVAGCMSAADHTSLTGKMTNPMTTPGDVIVGGTSGNPGRLALGTNGQVLGISSGVVGWVTPSSGFADPTTTAGDIIIHTGGGTVRLPIGTTGQVLTVVSGLPAWANAASGFANPMTTLGDLIAGGASGAPARLGVGSNGQVLTVTSGAPAWATPAAGFTNPMSAVNDLILGGTSGAATRLPVGSLNQVLTVGSGGVVWANAPSGFTNPMSAVGDVIIGGAGGTATRLAAGTSGYVLKSNGTSSAPSWQVDATGGGGVGSGALSSMPTASAGSFYIATDRPAGQQLEIGTGAGTSYEFLSLGASACLHFVGGALDIVTTCVPQMGNPNTFTQVNTFQRGVSTASNAATYGTTVTMDLALGNTQTVTLTGAATLALANIVPGHYDFVICQDATGTRAWTWATGMHGTMTVGSTASTCSAQSFVATGTTAASMYALSAGVINQ